jgi:hypothetical protein
MKFDSKLVFHVPLYAKVDDKIIGNCYSDFETALIHKCSSSCTCNIQISTVQVYRFDKNLDEHLVTVFCNDSDTCVLVDIFLHLICDYHSDLLQITYLYEQNDIQIAVLGVSDGSLTADMFDIGDERSTEPVES